MQSHGSGPIKGTRNGALATVHTLPFDVADITATTTNRKSLTIRASATNPVMVRAHLIPQTNFNSGTTATLAIGTTSGGSELISAQTVRTGAGAIFTYSAIDPNFFFYVADTDIWMSLVYSGAAPTTGKAWVILEMWEFNSDIPNSQDN